MSPTHNLLAITLFEDEVAELSQDEPAAGRRLCLYCSAVYQGADPTTATGADPLKTRGAMAKAAAPRATARSGFGLPYAQRASL